jgi:8-oxo-dGTP pyrophosphatase MutT (NUDIX family)
LKSSALKVSEEPARTQFAALPWRRLGDGGIEVLLITSRETRRWVIPKGWGKPEEDPVAAAAREAFEETGVKGALGKAPLGDYHYGKVLKTGRVQPVTVTVYALEVAQERKSWPEKDEREKLWVPPAIAAGLVDEPELKSLIAGFAP